MTFLPTVSATVSGLFPNGRSTPETLLQRVIRTQVPRGTMRHYSNCLPDIIAPFYELTNAVESAFVLVPREALPKVGTVIKSETRRQFYFRDDPYMSYSTDPNHTAEQARKTAAKWLAIAGHLEGEEKAAAAEAKKKADAEAAAKNARNKRISELAYEYFDTAVEELGARKTRVIEEVYRLEQELETAGEDSCGCL